MRPVLNTTAMGNAILMAVALTVSISSFVGAEDQRNVDNQAAVKRYEAAIQAAEDRLKKSVAAARAQFLLDVKKTQAKPQVTPTSDLEKGVLENLPVSVTGADPMALVEGTDNRGWFDIPKNCQRAVIFQTRKDQPMDGVLVFQVKRDGLVAMAASWAYDGNSGGGWQSERKSKQDILKSGWVEVGHMYLNLSDRHTIFVRQCKQGEQFRIRTRKYRRPYVVVLDALAKQPPAVAAKKPAPNVVVEVAMSKTQPTKEFLSQGMPADLEGTTAYISPLTGVAIVRVHQRGKVFAAASWDYDGNSSGQWTEERWTKQMFLDRGWKEIGKVSIKHRGSQQPHILFVRDCNKGDHFRIRTRKYGAPFVFAL